MSLGRKLSLDAGAALWADDGGVARSRREHEPVARPHRNTTAVRKDEIDRASRAVQKLGVAMLVRAVRVAWRVRPPIYITSFAAQLGLDHAGIGCRGLAVPTEIDLH